MLHSTQVTGNRSITSSGCSRPPGSSRSRVGLTLLELLIVMAIVSVLAAILFPVFQSGRRMAHRSVCLSNLHQIHLALMLYSDDYDTTYPSFKADPASALHAQDQVYWHDHFCRGNRGQNGDITWASLLRLYARPSTSHSLFQTDNIFRCPSDDDLGARPVTSYEYKMWLAEGAHQSDISEPGAFAAIWEQWSYHSEVKLSEHDRMATLNCLLADGHSLSVRLADTTTARFGLGPNLHWVFVGKGTALDYTGADLIK